MAEILLRDAVAADAPAIAVVHIASWRATYRGMIPDEVLDGLSVAERTEQWYGRIATSETLLAVDGDLLLGFCELLREDPPHIRALYLDPAALRRGTGTLLMRETLRRLRAAGEREVTLDVVADNVGARGFYDRFGFEQTGQGEWHGAQELQMRLVLAS